MAKNNFIKQLTELKKKFLEYAEEKVISDEMEGTLKKAIEEFKKQFN